MHRQEVVERLAGGHFIDLLVSNLERVTQEVLTTGNTGDGVGDAEGLDAG